MKITRVETLIPRLAHLDRFGGQGAGPAAFGNGLYHFEAEWNEVHPIVSQCVLVRIETRAGHGVGKPAWKQADEGADSWAFVLWQLGVEAGRGGYESVSR